MSTSVLEPSQSEIRPNENILRSVLVCSLPALILSAACLLPYLNKAFTIDDPIFLILAQQIRKAPLQPTAVSICWTYDATCPRAAHAMFLMGYVLAPVVNSHAAEILAHLIQIFLLWCGIVATVSLAFRFGLGTFGACASGLLVAAAPPVLAASSTAMPDTLAMSLGVIGIERLMAWKSDGRFIHGLASALALGLAPLARVHLVGLWLIGALLLRDDGRIFDVRSWFALPKRRWLPLLAAGLVMYGVLALTRDRSSGISEMNGMSGFSAFIIPDHALSNFRSYLLYWIIALPLGLPWLILRNRRLKLWILLPIAPVGFLLPVMWAVGGAPAHEVWGTMCAGLGAFVIIDVLLSSYQKGDIWRTACALWLLIPLVALPYIHLPVKYLVMCAPAAALLVADELSAFHWRGAALCGIVTAGAIFGSLVLSADARFADMGRQAATRLVAPHVVAGQRVWLSSQWGFYWYAVKAGAQALRADDVPSRGDYLVRGGMEGYPQTLYRLPPAALVDAMVFGGPCGRTMSPKDGAGLYDNPAGDLMWAWGEGEWNHYELWYFQ